VPSSRSTGPNGQGTWVAAVRGTPDATRTPAPLIGVLRGEGIGPEVVDAALLVLDRLTEADGAGIEVVEGGVIGREAETLVGTPLPEDVVDFCRGILDRGGAVLNGPGGGRYVYDLRRRLELFLKISPIQARNGLPGASPLRPEVLEDVDVLVVRENMGGVYQGEWDEQVGAGGGRLARHSFTYSDAEVGRFLQAAARICAFRRGELTVVTKEAGVPSVSRLWRDCAIEAAEAAGVRLRVVDVDLMAYELVRRPSAYDVVAAPNLCGDVLGDLAAVALGSRAASYGASFTAGGDGVYQTNHGAAYDIAGTESASPAGQILSLAALLRESLGLEREAQAVEDGLRQVWADGRRTADVAGPGDRVVGTREMATLVADAAAARLGVALGAA